VPAAFNSSLCCRLRRINASQSRERRASQRHCRLNRRHQLINEGQSRSRRLTAGCSHSSSVYSYLQRMILTFNDMDS
jgi:hypothetical protein